MQSGDGSRVLFGAICIDYRAAHRFGESQAPKAVRIVEVEHGESYSGSE